MIRVFDAFSGIGGFRSALERVGGFEIVGGARLTDLRRKPTKHCTIPEVNNFMKISEILTSENLQTLISLLEVSLPAVLGLRSKKRLCRRARRSVL